MQRCWGCVCARIALTGTTSEDFCWTQRLLLVGLFSLYSMSLMGFDSKVSRPSFWEITQTMLCRVVLKNLFFCCCCFFLFRLPFLELLEAVWVLSECISEQFGQNKEKKKEKHKRIKAVQWSGDKILITVPLTPPPRPVMMAKLGNKRPLDESTHLAFVTFCRRDFAPACHICFVVLEIHCSLASP